MEISSTDPDLSPDNQAIVFVRDDQIATMNLDGTDLVVLTNWTSGIAHPSWQPIIITNQTLSSNDGNVNAVAWSPDGTRIAGSGADGLLRI